MTWQGNLLQVRTGQALPGKSRACNAILQSNVKSALLFCVKEEFLQWKTNTGLSRYDTEGPCKVWSKTESCFSNESPLPSPLKKRIGQFVLSAQKGSKFDILWLSFVWMVNFLNQKPSQEFYFVALNVQGKFGPQLSRAFYISQKKLLNFFQVGEKGPSFIFYCFLLSEK